MFLPREKAPEYLTRRIDDRRTFDELHEFPAYVYLEVTADCNASCRMCAFAHRGNRFIDEDMYDKLKKEIVANKDNLKYVVLQGRGEPLLDEKLAERVRFFSKEHGIPTFISTNCSLLDEKKATELLEANVGTIVLSIDSLNKENFEKIRNGLDFEEVYNNVIQFIELRNKINPSTQVRIRMIEQEQNMGEWESYEEFWKPKLAPHDRLTVKKVHAWGGKLKIKEVLDVETDQDHFPCVCLWSYFAILYDGTVPLCPGDGAIEKYNLGNVGDSSIKEMWKSSVYEKYRESHLNGEKIPAEMCKGCRMYAEPSDFEHIGKSVFPELYEKETKYK
jgi:MoaA/NifB/PqqE/SkfB family radical SAM enzyme